MAHEAVIGHDGIAARCHNQGQNTLNEGLNLKYGAVFFRQALGHFDGGYQLLLNDARKICSRGLRMWYAEKSPGAADVNGPAEAIGKKDFGRCSLV